MTWVTPTKFTWWKERPNPAGCPLISTHVLSHKHACNKGMIVKKAISCNFYCYSTDLQYLISSFLCLDIIVHVFCMLLLTSLDLCLKTFIKFGNIWVVIFKNYHSLLTLFIFRNSENIITHLNTFTVHWCYAILKNSQKILFVPLTFSSALFSSSTLWHWLHWYFPFSSYVL